MTPGCSMLSTDAESMPSKPDYAPRDACWREDAEALAAIRRRVFIEEQGVPEALEWDGLDEHARHVLAETPDGRAIGCARLLDDGHIGRMAVLPEWRGLGVGGVLLRRLLERAAEAGLPRCWLDAQTHATGFYRRFGFHEEGEEFLDAGIPHRRMRHDPTRS